MNKTPKLRFKEFSGEWEEKRLGESINLYDNERKPVKEKERNTGKYAYYGATGIIDYIDDYIFEGEYLLLGEDGANIVTRNAPLIYKTCGKFWVNNHAHIFKPKKDFSIDFMKQRLELINYIPYNTGTAQPKLNSESIKLIPFRAPSIEEQEKIASFFSLIDDKISLQSEKVEKLKEYKKGMMQKIFSRELRFKDDSGKEYPEWENKKLGEIFSIKAGGDIDIEKVSKEITEIHKYPVYANSLTDKGLYGYTDTFKVEGDTITVTGRGVNIGYAIARKEKYYPIVRLLVLSPLCDLNTKYFENVINYTNIFVESTGVPQLTSPQLSNVKVSVPKLEEQEKIAKLLNNIDLKFEKEQEKLDSLNEYKKGLLQQMFV